MDNTTTRPLSAIVAILTAATLMLTGTVALVGNDHMAFAWKKSYDGLKRGEGKRINIITPTTQKLKCQTAGGSSPITGSCTATVTNNVDNSGGIISESGGHNSINIITPTTQKLKCQTAGGSSPITGSCTATVTNNVDNSGGIIINSKDNDD
jgi:hypothetical protein